MKKYTQHDIDQFFNTFKELPTTIKLEDVHQLINRPDVKARHVVKLHFKNLKFIIMTSTFLMVIASIVFWPTPDLNQNSSITRQKGKTPQNSESTKIAGNFNEPATFKPDAVSIESHITTEIIDEILDGKNNNNQISPVMVAQDSVRKDYVTPWPDDSIIQGEKYIISLSIEEARKIGVVINEGSIHFKSSKGGSLDFNYGPSVESGGGTTLSRYKEKENEYTSSIDYRPIVDTDDLYFQRFYKREKFSLMNDTLLPIKFQLKDEGFRDYIFWFTVSDNLFNDLPDRYKYLRTDYKRIVENKRNHGETDLIRYGVGDVTLTLKMVELSSHELKNLGFDIQSTSIHWPFHADEKGYSLIGFNNRGSEAKYIQYSERDTITIQATMIKYILDSVKYKNAIKLFFVSNEFGEQNIRFDRREATDRNTDAAEYFRNKAPLLVPIYLKQKDYPNQLSENQIFWFEASEALFDLLPEQIGSQLKQEYNYITANKEERKNLTTSCTYFEECKSNLIIENLKLYPNPANSSITIDFTIPEAVTGIIYLSNISGAQVKRLASKTAFTEGNNSFQIDVSDIIPGIYLVMIKTPKGFKSQRLIVSR